MGGIIAQHDFLQKNACRKSKKIDFGQFFFDIFLTLSLVTETQCPDTEFLDLLLCTRGPRLIAETPLETFHAFKCGWRILYSTLRFQCYEAKLVVLVLQKFV